MRRTRRFGRGGSVALEFALTMPLMLTLAAAVVDFGWYFTQQMAVVHAVREGARAAALTARDDDPAAAGLRRAMDALDAANIPYDASDLSAAITGTPPMELVEVSAALDYEPIVTLVPVPLTLSATLSMRLEDQDD